jgi:molybdopterin-guanine dinucleotide biosynthesis protein A
MKFTGYILTGGKSSRMGTDKAFLKIGEKTFLENAAEVLEPGCETVKAVLNKTQDQFIETLPANVSPIFDIYENRGALGGMHAAFKDCKTAFAVILAIDLPFVTSEAIAKLCEIADASGKYLACVPRQTNDRPQPLCAVYRAGYCLPALEKLLDETGSASVKDFLDIIFPRYISADQLSADENFLQNVNRPEDFQQAKFYLSQSGV